MPVFPLAATHIFFVFSFCDYISETVSQWIPDITCDARTHRVFVLITVSNYEEIYKLPSLSG